MADSLSGPIRRPRPPLPNSTSKPRALPTRQPSESEQDIFNALVSQPGNAASAAALLSQYSNLVGQQPARRRSAQLALKEDDRQLPSRPSSQRPASAATATPAAPAAAAKRPSLPQQAQRATRPTTAAAPSDSDLVASMASRLRSLERQLQMANEQLQRKDSMISTLRGKLKEVELLQAVQPAANETDTRANVRQLHHEYSRLQRQVHAMEAFLADYGMVWVGDDSDNDEEDGDATRHAGSRPSSSQAQTAARASSATVARRSSLLGSAGQTKARPASANHPRPLSKRHRDSTMFEPIPDFVPDFERVIKNVGELNVLAGEGVASIVVDADGTRRLQAPEPVPLTLYSNGFLMFAGPFRAYSEPTAQMVMRDLMDGYFPWELRNRYPEGIPFAIRDLRSQLYAGPTRNMAFPGTGYAVGGRAGPSRLVATSPTAAAATFPKSAGATSARPAHKPNFQVVGAPEAPVSMETFLQKLPVNVIRNGCIIDIRQGLANLLQGATQTNHKVKLVESAVTRSLAEARSDAQPASNMASSSRRSVSEPKEIATLRIKTEDGSETLIVKLRFQDKLSDLMQCIDGHRQSCDKCKSRQKTSYQLITTYPRKVLTTVDATLFDLGLTPNATLRMFTPPR